MANTYQKKKNKSNFYYDISYSQYYAEACNKWRNHLRGLASEAQGNTASKKRRSGGEPLATLRKFD